MCASEKGIPILMVSSFYVSPHPSIKTLAAKDSLTSRVAWPAGLGVGAGQHETAKMSEWKPFPLVGVEALRVPKVNAAGHPLATHKIALVFFT